jgi:hypothetical protein
MTKAGVNQAYLDGCRKVGLDLSADVCVGYKDNAIDSIEIEKLVNSRVIIEDHKTYTSVGNSGTTERQYTNYVLNCKPHLQVAYEERDGRFCMDPELFANLWMGIAKLGDPNLEWSIVEPYEVDIGGYGLFDR